MVSVTNSMDMNLNELLNMVEDRGAVQAKVCRVAKSKRRLCN